MSIATAEVPNAQEPSLPESLESKSEISEAETEIPVRSRLTLRDAVRLSGMSEKTLRRKLEAGLLSGTRESLDYGGFMWMIETQSLADLYPDSAQLRDYIQMLEQQLQDGTLEKQPTSSATSSQVSSAGAQPKVPSGSSSPTSNVSGNLAKEETHKEAEVAEKSSTNQDFVIYLLEENRCLKEDIREKEVRLRSLQERTMHLERECGEQRGTAATQARVLEWFQQQPQTQAALPAGPNDLPIVDQVVPAAPASLPNWSPQRIALVSVLLASVLIWVGLWLVRLAAG